MKKVKLSMLSIDEVNLIHQAELDILENTGIKISHEKVLKMLADIGAKVDFDTQVVRISTDLVEAALRKCPKNVVCSGRSKKDDRIMGPDQDHFFKRIAGAEETYVDPKTGLYRKGSVSDIADWIRVCDALNYDFVSGFYPDTQEVPVKIRDIVVAKTSFENSTKHFVIGPYDEFSFKYMIELAMSIRGGKKALKERPMLSILVASISPLQIPENQVDLILMGGEHGIPILLMPMPMAGSSAPCTVAGVVTMAGAEALAMNVIAQTANPGSPVVYTPRSGNIDMATGLLAMGVDWAIIAAAQTQMAIECYGIPIDVMGTASMSITTDVQAAIEAMLSSYASLAGANLVAGGGALETGLIADPVYTVIVSEISFMVQKIVGGFNVNQDTIARELIEEIGIGGEFMTSEHTLNHFRSEFYRCPLFNYALRDTWEAEGAKDMKEKAKEKTLDIMSKHFPEPLEEDLSKELDHIVEKAAKEAG